MMLYYLAGMLTPAALVIGVCTIAIVIEGIRSGFTQRRRKPGRTDSKLERIEFLIGRAAHCREFLHAYAAEMVELHGYDHDDREADDLRRVVYDGEDYSETIETIIERRYK